MFQLKKIIMNTLKGGKSIPPLSLFIAHGNGLWVAQDGMGGFDGERVFEAWSNCGSIHGENGQMPLSKK